MKKGKRQYGRMAAVCMLAAVLAAGAAQTAYAEDEDGAEKQQQIMDWTEETLTSQLELDDLDEALEEVLPEAPVTFTQLFASILKGEGMETAQLAAAFLGDTCGYAIRVFTDTSGYLLAVIAAAAVFGHFTHVFQNRQIADIGFYMMYILLSTLCLKSFQLATEQVRQSLEQLLVFMQILSPAYFVCMAVSTGSVSSVAFYNLALALIWAAEFVIVQVLLPLIHVTMIVRMLTFLSEEAELSRFVQLLETIVTWCLKTLPAVVTGIGIVQGLLNPAMDAVRRSALSQGTRMIPGLGDAVGGAAEVVLGTAVLIKNGIGVAGAVCCIGLTVLPVLNMAVPALGYQCLAAFAQPVSDARIVDALAQTASGYRMMLRLVLTTGMLFLLTIGISAVFTS